MLCSTNHPHPIQSKPISDISTESPPSNFAIHVARSRAELPPLAPALEYSRSASNFGCFQVHLGHSFLGICVHIGYSRPFLLLGCQCLGRAKKYKCSLNHDWRAPANFAARKENLLRCAFCFDSRCGCLSWCLSWCLYVIRSSLV